MKNSKLVFTFLICILFFSCNEQESYWIDFYWKSSKMGGVNYKKAAIFVDFSLEDENCNFSSQLDTGSTTFFKDSIINCKVQFPVYILEYDEHFEINITSDYEEWELETEILKHFPEYNFTENLEKGRKEIRLQISRYQSDYCTDGWGRPIENPLNQTKYLIRKAKSKSEKFNPKIVVLFDDSEHNYYVNIVDGINKNSGEKGFLLLNEFKAEDNNNKFELLKDRLYKNRSEAFSFGHLKMQGLVNDDFKEYLKDKKILSRHWN